MLPLLMNEFLASSNVQWICAIFCTVHLVSCILPTTFKIIRVILRQERWQLRWM